MSSLGPEVLMQLMDEHSARLVLFAQQLCDVPEDIVQDALVQLVRQEPAPVDRVAWLYRTVRNGAISAARSRRRRDRHETTAATDKAAWFVTVEGDGLDAMAAVKALEALPIELRETIVLRLWSGLSFEQIAALTETSSSTAHRRYGEGLAALRSRLGISTT
jgi:RNA polymerase sigma factor (sigma-70 family)